MQLSLHADYALRVLIYLGAHPEHLVRTQDISDAYGISKHHLVRVVQTLGHHGYVSVHPGRSGGITLAKPPAEIRLGRVVRDAEPNLKLVECFDPVTNTCPIVPACALKGMLSEALESFLTALDRYTLADVLTGDARPQLVSLLTSSGVATTSSPVRAEP